MDPLIPQEAPGGYATDDKYPDERARVAFVVVLSGLKAGFERLVFVILDMWKFYNATEWYIDEVFANPHDFGFNWFAR
jgi:hypothetical protein